MGNEARRQKKETTMPSEKNTITINRSVYGFEIHAVATYDKGADVWDCTVTSSFGKKFTRKTTDAWDDLQDLIECAIDSDKERFWFSQRDAEEVRG